MRFGIEVFLGTRTYGAHTQTITTDLPLPRCLWIRDSGIATLAVKVGRRYISFWLRRK
jgi:hypothetical protein